MRAGTPAKSRAQPSRGGGHTGSVGDVHTYELELRLVFVKQHATHPGFDDRLDPGRGFFRCLGADEMTPLSRVFKVGARQARLERKDVRLRRAMTIRGLGRNQEDVELSELAEDGGILELRDKIGVSNMHRA